MLGAPRWVLRGDSCLGSEGPEDPVAEVSARIDCHFAPTTLARALQFEPTNHLTRKDCQMRTSTKAWIHAALSVFVLASCDAGADLDQGADEGETESAITGGICPKG